MQKSFFLVLEGPDRSGKSTQAALLKTWLENQGKTVVLTREPGGTAVSEKVRQILLDPAGKVAPLTELFLFATARCQHTLEIIKPALEQGKFVISDRFTLSTEAYQGYGRGINLDEIKKINNIATSGIKPNLTIVFNLPDEEFEHRIRKAELNAGPDRFEAENIDFRLKVKKAYADFSKRSGIITIDASKGIEDIQAELRKIVTAKLLE